MALKLKIRTLFPALVSVLSPLTLVKNGLSYVFGLDFNALRALLDPYYGPGAFTIANRIPLTGDTVFYFRSDASNIGRTGLVDSAAGAFKDLQQLWDYVADTYDARGFKVIFQASGPTPRTMTTGLATNKGITGANGPQNVFILGSATPSDFIISTTSADCISVGALLFGNAQFTIGGFKLQTTTGGNCINISGGGCEVSYGTQGYPINFGSCAQSHVVGNHNCNLFAGGSGNTVSGAALVHASSLSGATTALHGVPIIFVGGANSLSFTNGFYDCESNATLFIDNITYTNIAAVNTGFASGLAASGGFIINYPATSALPGNGAVAEIGLGKYLATGLENVKISDVTGMAAGVAAFLATPSSANLATALTNETGTAGSAVFSVSPALTGTPTAPTAAVDNNTTQLATTAMVLAQAAAATPLAVTNTAAVGTSTRFARADHVHAFESAAWTTYTPTITSQGGTLTGTTITPTGRYKQIGKTVIVEINIALTNVGSGTPTGGVRATLPIAAAAFTYSASVYESSVTGKSGAGFINGPVAPTYVSLSDYSGATFWVNGYNLVMTMTYEVP